MRLARLDDLVDELALPPPDVVKIDVEGAEVAVLRGARRTLATSRPVIVGEFNSGLMPTFGTTFLDVLPNMPGGYEVYSFTSDRAVRRTSPRVGLGEVLLVPRERAEELSTALDVRPSTDGETR